MLQTRVIPTLLLRGKSLVKTVRFGKFNYVGDPANTVRIFNELEVDELIFLDISVSQEGHEPNFKLLAEIANECFMPLGYGGGISNLRHAQTIFEIGFEKIAINTHSFVNKELITEIADVYGSQAVIASIDVKTSFFGKPTVCTLGKKLNKKYDPVAWAKEVENLGAGEILLTCIDREGTWSGFDLEIVKSVADAVSIPVIAHGGAGSIEHLRQVVKEAHASAVALGSMVVFQKKGMGVLVNFPEKEVLEEVLS